MNNADKLLNYKKLLDSGAITQEEFEDKKKECLSVGSETGHQNMAINKQVKKKIPKLLVGLLITVVVLVPIIGWLNTPSILSTGGGLNNSRIDILEGVSEQTRGNLGAMMTELDGLMSISFMLEYSKEPVNEGTQGIISNGLNDILSEFTRKNNISQQDSIITLNDLFQGGGFSAAEQQELLDSSNVLYTDYINKATGAQNIINGIVSLAVKENRALSVGDINKFREATQEIRDVIITALSSSADDEQSIKDVLANKKYDLETQYISDMLTVLKP